MIKKAGVTFVNILLLFSAGSGACKQAQSSERQHFSAEGDITKEPVSVPKSVLTILAKDKHVQGLLEDENIQPEKIPSSWFLAGTVHLSSHPKTDLVVMGVGPLRGANVVTFWVFCATVHGYELVLTAPAHDLIVKNTRWKGHYEITLMSATAKEVFTVWYRFDGKRYVEYKSGLEPID